MCSNLYNNILLHIICNSRIANINSQWFSIVVFYILKELQQYNSGLEYELKLENERLQKIIAKLQRENEALNKALKEMQNKKKWH